MNMCYLLLQHHIAQFISINAAQHLVFRCNNFELLRGFFVFQFRCKILNFPNFISHHLFISDSYFFGLHPNLSCCGKTWINAPYCPSHVHKPFINFYLTFPYFSIQNKTFARFALLWRRFFGVFFVNRCFVRCILWWLLWSIFGFRFSAYIAFIGWCFSRCRHLCLWLIVVVVVIWRPVWIRLICVVVC